MLEGEIGILETSERKENIDVSLRSLRTVANSGVLSRRYCRSEASTRDPLGQLKAAQGDLWEGPVLKASPLGRDLASGHN